MSASVNKVILIGNLGADPEVRVTQQGVKIVTLSIATSETWRDKGSGEKKERTEWSRVVIFGTHESDGLAGVAEKYLKKGSKCLVEGKLQTRKWQDKDGTDRYTTEIVLQGFGANLVLLDGKGEGGNRPPPPDSPDDYGTPSSRPGAARAGQGEGNMGEVDDEIPF